MIHRRDFLKTASVAGAALATGERAVVFCGTGSVAYGGVLEALARAGATGAPWFSNCTWVRSSLKVSSRH